MFNLALIITLSGFMIWLGLTLWSRQRQALGDAPAVEQVIQSMPVDSTGNAIIVAQEYGNLIYLNERARDWLDVNSGLPSLELLARKIQPVDSFLSLFSGENHTTFQIDGRWVEAYAHQIPAGEHTNTVVLVRELTGAGASLDLAQAMTIINEIGETVDASLGIEETLQALLAIIQKILPADSAEVCLWDPEARALYPRGWFGDSSYMIAVANRGGQYEMGEGITGWVARYREPLLVADVRDGASVRPALSENPYQSFVAVPLEMGEDFIGTLEFASRQRNYFSQAHLSMLQALSQPVATAIYNAKLYSAQSQRIDDLASLQQVAQESELETDASAVYLSLNERIAGLLSADICGVLIYDPRRERLVGQSPFYGLPDTLVSYVSVPVGETSAAADFWERQDHAVFNDLSQDLTDDSVLEGWDLEAAVSAASIRNIAFYIMRVGRQRIGAILVANKRTGDFNNQDIQNLRILVAQASIVVENIRLFKREQRHDTELHGLQEITHAVGALSSDDEVHVYSDINRRIANLMDLEMCGILLYDPEGERLVSQLPFYGVADALIEGYEISLKAGSVLQQIWDDQDFWYTNRAGADSVVYAAGLETLVEQVKVEKTMMASLTAGGRKIGVIQVSNKRNGEDFNDNDARLLLIFATQAAAIIENARLVREVRRRAEEADRLRRVAELAGGVLTLDQSLDPLLAEIAQLTESELVFISILDETSNALVTIPGAVLGAELDQKLVIDAASDEFARCAAIAREPFLSNNASVDCFEIEGYRVLTESLQIRRVIFSPLMIGDRSLGEVGIANREGVPYESHDVQLLGSVAAQIASTIERTRLYEETGRNLNRRVQELESISRVSYQLTTTLELDTVLNTIRVEAARATDADGGTVVLLHPPDRWKDPRIPELDLRIGEQDTISGLADIEVEAVNRGADIVLVERYDHSRMRAQPVFSNSGVAGAFIYADAVVGVIHLFDQRPNHFDERAASFLKTLAAKAALGYGNAIRYREQLQRSDVLRQRVEQLNQIFELGQMLQTNVDQTTMLEAIAYSIVQSVGFDVVVITMLDREAGLLKRVTQAGLPVDAFERSKADVLPLEFLPNLLHEELRISESYFYPIDKIEDWHIAGLDALSAAFVGNRSIHPRGRDAWRDGDMLLVPIAGAGGELLGIMSLDRPQDNQRPDRSKIEILEIFAHQAATTIENNRLFLDSLRSAELEARLNEMLEAVAATLDVDQIVESVAQSALRLVPFNRMSIALLDTNNTGYDMRHVDVSHDGTLTLRHEHLASLENTAMLRSIHDITTHTYMAGEVDVTSFPDLADRHEHGERMSVILPLASGGTVIGAMHFGSDDERNLNVDEYRSLLNRISKLVAVAIQNARLFNQAVNLQVFNESVVESIQQGIVVLDRNSRVMTINQFMRDEFGWDQRIIRQNIFSQSNKLAGLMRDEVNGVLSTGEPQQQLGVEFTQQGHHSILNFYIYPLISGRDVSGAVLLVEDVTERARLEANVQARADQLAALTAASSQITQTLRREQVIDYALDAMQDIIAYDTMTIWTSESADVMAMEGGRGWESTVEGPIRMRIADRMRLQQVVESQAVVTISDLPTYLRTYKEALPGDGEAQSWLGVPLVHQERVVGMIAMTKKESGFYTEQSEKAARAFANQVAIALSNAELFSETTARTERLSLLNRVSLALVQSMDSENIFEIAMSEIATALGADRARAVHFNQETGVGRVIVDYPRSHTTPTATLALHESATYGYILERLQPLVYSHNPENMPEALSAEIEMEIEALGLQDYLLIPMVAPGRVIGAFEFEARNTRMMLGPEQLELGLIVANQAAIAVQNATQLEETTIRTRELETLLEAAQSTSLTLDLQEVFRSVVHLMINALDMDDCAILILDAVENVLEVQIDVNRQGDPDRISPTGTRLDVSKYPARMRALNNREVVVVHVDDDFADETEVRELHEQGDSARMLVPLAVRDQVSGLIQVEVRDPHRKITEQETRLARALGAQVAIAIENARLSTETAAQMDELFIINDLSQAISSTIDIENMLRIVRDQVPNVTGANELYLALYDETTDQIEFPLAARSGEMYDIPARKLNTDEVSFIIRNRRPLLLGGDYFSPDEVRKSLGISNGEGDVRSYLGVPLIAGDKVLGVLAVKDRERTRVFGINDSRILTTVGSQLGATVQNARLFEQIQTFADDLNRIVEERTEQLEEERDRLDMLYQITAELALTLDMDRVLSRALQMMASAVKAHDGVIMLIDPMTDSLYNRASLSRQLPGAESERPSHPAEQLATWLIHNDHELLVDDLHDVEYWDPTKPGAADWRSAMAVLLETNEDVQGVLVLLSRNVTAFSEPLLNLVIAAANQVASAINNADLYQLIRDQAERLGTLLRQEQEQAEKSTAILEGIADGVLLTDDQGKVSLFNSAAEEIFGLRRDHVMGRTLTELANHYGDDVAAWARPIADLSIDPNQNLQADVQFGRIAVGNKVVSVNIAPVSIGPQYLGQVSVFRDVSREVEVDRLKNEFIQRVTHELRTPLTPIKGYADLLLNAMQSNIITRDGQHDALSIIKVNADRLAALVEDLLSISKLDSGGERLHIEPVDLVEVISMQLSSAQSRNTDKNIQIITALDESVPRANVDRHKITQVVNNIIDNAFNYTPAGGKIEVELSLDPENDQNVLFTVRDTGVGIPDEFRDRIWERFVRYDEHALNTGTPGTGLGLAIVRNLVDMHSGQVWFESVSDEGTTFYVSMPIDHVEATQEIRAVSGD